MDGKLKTREYLKLCQEQWHWILNNYDRLIKEGYKDIWYLKGAYFDEYGLDEPESGCYLCELTCLTCRECPLTGIAWRRGINYPCVNDKSSVYLMIKHHLDDGRYEEAKDAIKWFLSIVDNECRRW